MTLNGEHMLLHTYNQLPQSVTNNVMYLSKNNGKQILSFNNNNKDYKYANSHGVKVLGDSDDENNIDNNDIDERSPLKLEHDNDHDTYQLCNNYLFIYIYLCLLLLFFVFLFFCLMKITPNCSVFSVFSVLTFWEVLTDFMHF